MNNNEFHEDMAAHDAAVKKQNKKEDEIWEDVLFKIATEIMTRKESSIREDLIKKYKIQLR